MSTPEALSLAIKALEPFSLYADCFIGETPNSLMVSGTFSVETLRAARTALQSLRQISQPDSGWRLVPIEPTEEMVEHGVQSVADCNFGLDHASPIAACTAEHTYRAMLAAAPAPLDLAGDDESRPVEPAGKITERVRVALGLWQNARAELIEGNQLAMAQVRVEAEIMLASAQRLSRAAERLTNPSDAQP